MGKLHKHHNWKSRQIVKTLIDETEQKKIQLDFVDDSTNYDACNALVLPSTKRKTKKLKNKDDGQTKLLSRKQRKKLMKIQEKKLKKTKREHLLEELQKVQAKPKDMAVLTSLQSIQTMGRKKCKKLDLLSVISEESENKNKSVQWKTSKSVKRELSENILPPKKRVKDLNVVQSESSSSSEEESESDSEKEKSEIEIITLENETQKVNGNERKGDDENHPNDKDCDKSLQNQSQGKDSNNICTTEDSTKINSEEKQDKSVDKKKVVKIFKRVSRDPDLQKLRLKLPILSEEHTVMEAISENLITLIVGQTGSGKTTQVPQFLYEAGYTRGGKMIGVTEPRRVAAISMAERVGFEMNLPSKKVSYQIRFEGNTTPKTEIKFMTDGVLFKEILQSHLLDKYSAIIIDEAHERSVHSDILIGLLSRIVPKRNKLGNPLKLIIMSATLRIEDFTQNPILFKNPKPPVVKIDPRMYDVTIHFNRITDPDYCDAAYRKICKIHRQLPDGGILVFLTGQQEIIDLCKKLKSTFPAQDSKDETKDEKKSSFNKRIKDKKEKIKKQKQLKGAKIPEVNLNYFSSRPATTGEEKDASNSEDEEEEEVSSGFLVEAEQPLWVLPLYSLLPRHKQKQVFAPPPHGTRLCVVATNIAETSLTIPNIKYVVDSGKTKEKIFDPVTGVSTYCVIWTSKASANQRAGRAGRTSDGFCYRLYSSAVFNDELPEYSLPDIQKRPLDDVVLTMKALKVPVAKFPFPTPPDSAHLSQSIKRLTVLGALEHDEKLLRKKYPASEDTTVITEMGRSIAALPLAPRFGKMILYSNQHKGILPYIILLIAALTVQEIFVEIPLGSQNLNPVQKQWESQRLKWSGTGASHLLGDLLVLINAVLEAELNNASLKWCLNNGIRHSALMEIRKLRRQLTNEINLIFPEMNVELHPTMTPPTHQQACIIAEVVIMGSLDQVARKVDACEIEAVEDKQVWRNAYRTLYSEKPVFLSSASALHKNKPKFVMYQDIHETTKIYLRVLTVVDEAWLLHHGANLVELSPPLDVPPPKFDTKKDQVICSRKGTFGPHQWPLRECEMPFPFSKDLFKWVAYFLLIGDLWPTFKDYHHCLYDPKTLISPISLRFREKRENLINALMAKNVISAKSLEKAWREEPLYLKSPYLAWVEDLEKVELLMSKWPPLTEEGVWRI